jgi:DNA-binding transcriptional regulator GbsR (MarR family)
MNKLTVVQQKFILHWGEMGTRWGVNRTVAQVHALLYISPKPLNADDIVETLDVARSNVSTSLKELQGWGIVKLVHVLGDKRDHFETMKDVWEMFRVVLDERKKREFDRTRRPTPSRRNACASCTSCSRSQRRGTRRPAAGRPPRCSSS